MFDTLGREMKIRYMIDCRLADMEDQTLCNPDRMVENDLPS
jgi:hypothetical protein